MTLIILPLGYGHIRGMKNFLMVAVVAQALLGCASLPVLVPWGLKALEAYQVVKPAVQEYKRLKGNRHGRF